MENIFLAQNPWQTDANWQEQRLITRRLQAKIWDWIDEKDVLGITGARQTGKTTLLKQLISELIYKKHVSTKNIFYFSFNDYNLCRAVLKDPKNIFNFIDQQKDKDQKAYIFLDEISKAPLSNKLLKAYANLNDYKFIFSTSSALDSNIKEDSFEYLINFHLYPLTFLEFIDLKYPQNDIIPLELNIKANQSIKGFFQDYTNFEDLIGLFEELKLYQKNLNNALENYLLIGGLPSVIRGAIPQALDKLKEISHLYLERDAGNILKIEKHFELFNLLELSAQQIGNTIRLDEIGKNLRVSFPTLKNFMNILEKIYTVKFLEPFSENQKKGIRKTKKPYFLDTGLRNTWANTTTLSQDTSHLIENLVFILLQRFNSYLLDDFCELLFFRTYDGAEVDFLLKARDVLFPVDVKYQNTNNIKIPIGLQNFMKANEISSGVVITNNFIEQKTFAFGNVYFIPLTLLIFMV